MMEALQKLRTAPKLPWPIASLKLSFREQLSCGALIEGLDGVPSQLLAVNDRHKFSEVQIPKFCLFIDFPRLTRMIEVLCKSRDFRSSKSPDVGLIDLRFTSCRSLLLRPPHSCYFSEFYQYGSFRF
ncbi:hypothetical protein MLD38_003404 [Melastoma candidum]|uniref:Uncharacterized protein n=1 Tax=Melastoma candidum TaxID=119954 RepID=A0ACB9S708_9MYRT|nr:hypothetical protein MLD38_003404 [Melastoma candidum]